VAVRREDERNVVELADTVAFALLQAVLRWQVLAFRFDDAEGNRFGARLERTA
jgi:hypothetical protein